MANSAFILANVMKPDGGAASAPVASSYRLDAADSKLSPHVGHKVEVSGTLDTSAPPSAAAGSAPAAPKLKVDNVRMIAASCTP
jgi:hypothetical protein